MARLIYAGTARVTRNTNSNHTNPNYTNSTSDTQTQNELVELHSQLHKLRMSYTVSYTNLEWITQTSNNYYSGLEWRLLSPFGLTFQG